MDCLIRMSDLPTGKSYMPQLVAAFRLWDGTRYYVTPSPRNLLKRAVADTVLNVAGFSALHLMLGVVDALRPKGKPYLDTLHAPTTDADREDASHIEVCEARAESSQAAAGLSRATMASSANR